MRLAYATRASLFEIKYFLENLEELDVCKTTIKSDCAGDVARVQRVGANELLLASQRRVSHSWHGIS